MNAASIWIGVGVNVLIAGYLGQKKQDEANATVTHGLLDVYKRQAIPWQTEIC